MHPAPSVILFSTLSGAGFGLFVFLGLGLPAPTGFVAFGFHAIGYAFAVTGLLAATFHLKNRRNAWKSYREWRSSWLSREAWAAIAALLVMGLHALSAMAGLRLAPLGWLGAALSLATVGTTAMIYAQLRTVPRWNQPATPALFVTASLTGGALLSGNVAIALILLILLGLVTGFHWWKGDRRLAETGSSTGTATGLSGSVGTWERPHTGETYVTREMVYRIACKHAVKLRVIVILLLCVLPILLLILLGRSYTGIGAALLLHLAGVGVQRWLFFAEAEHVVGHYYGAHGKVAA
jgi:DMSO reductase anchor subunit